MNTAQLKTHYTTVTRAAAEVGVSRVTFYDWQKRGIPEEHQLRIQRLTNGELKADAPILERLRELVGQAA